MLKSKFLNKNEEIFTSSNIVPLFKWGKYLSAVIFWLLILNDLLLRTVFFFFPNLYPRKTVSKRLWDYKRQCLFFNVRHFHSERRDLGGRVGYPFMRTIDVFLASFRPFKTKYPGFSTPIVFARRESLSYKAPNFN